MTVYTGTLRRGTLICGFVLAIGMPALFPLLETPPDLIAYLMFGFLTLVGAAMVAAWIWVWRRPKRPVITLSTEGLYLHEGFRGFVPWGQLKDVQLAPLVLARLGDALWLSISTEAIDALEKTPKAERMRRIDEALGVHMLIIPETHSDRPLREVFERIQAFRRPLMPNGPPD